MSSEPLTTAPGDVGKSIPTFRSRLQTFASTARRPHGAAGLLPLGSAPVVHQITRPVTIRGMPAERSGPHTGDAGQGYRYRGSAEPTATA